MAPPHRRRSPLVAALSVSRRGGSGAEILDEIRRAILHGGVPPGSLIPVGEVATVFGVSPIPIREALKTLQGEGLVQHTPRGGYAVAQLTAQELRELYIVRESLEIAALAAAVPAAGDAERAEARRVHEAMSGALEAQDPLAYHRLSREFHIALVRPSRMVRLLHMLDSAWNVTEPVQPMVHVTAENRHRLHADHAEMLDAFVSGDEDALLAAAKEHNRRLNAVLTTLPTDIGLLAP
ncbi:GntR family transcriptional regulator [Millisia brevis]|uniref:GntR family transcriptional regulator n=1 Tax=Millisia brevis TaxID=264148 RepID=UPI0008335B6D|nr:GntR family transcriptional regulator [Millisia brevis]